MVFADYRPTGKTHKKKTKSNEGRERSKAAEREAKREMEQQEKTKKEQLIIKLYKILMIGHTARM
jgi:hypothetical protein